MNILSTHIDITALFKLMWRLWQSLLLKARSVSISPLARWNRATTFGGYNKIASRAVLGYSSIGRYTYISKDCYLPHCKIGSFCSIAPEVKIVNYRHPTDTFVSTSPVFYSTLRQCGTTFVSESLFDEQTSVDGWSAVIGHDVWIGNEARIMEGVTIGNGAIVAACALVTKDVPPYAIVGGVPAKVIRSRFDDEQTRRLESLEWWQHDDEWLRSHAAEFTDIERFLKAQSQ